MFNIKCLHLFEKRPLFLESNQYKEYTAVFYKDLEEFLFIHLAYYVLYDKECPIFSKLSDKAKGEIERFKYSFILAPELNDLIGLVMLMGNFDFENTKNELTYITGFYISHGPKEVTEEELVSNLDTGIIYAIKNVIKYEDSIDETVIECPYDDCIQYLLHWLCYKENFGFSKKTYEKISSLFRLFVNKPFISSSFLKTSVESLCTSVEDFNCVYNYIELLVTEKIMVYNLSSCNLGYSKTVKKALETFSN